MSSKEFGLWIPPAILQNKDLIPAEKMLLAAVIPLTFGRPCTAGNDHFASQLGLESQTVSNNLNSLHQKGYIRIFLDRKAGNKREIYTYIADETLFQYTGHPIEKFSIPLYKNFLDLYKKTGEGIEKDYRPSIKNLYTLYKNFVFNIKEEEEVEEEKEEEVEEEKNISLADSANSASEVESDQPQKQKKKKAPNPSSAPPLSPKPPSLQSRIRDEVVARDSQYYWEGKDAGNAKGIIDKIKFGWRAKHNDQEPTDDEIIETFCLILDHLPEFYQNKFSMSMLNSNYQSITSQIRDSFKKQSNGQPSTQYAAGKVDPMEAANLALAIAGLR